MAENVSLAPGDRLPDLEARGLDGGTISTRRHYLRVGLVVVFAHAWPCAACQAYLQELERHLAELRTERTEVIAVIPLVHTVVLSWEDRPLQHTVALAEGNELHSRAGFVTAQGTPGAGVVVTDDTGTIWQLWNSGEEHDLPDSAELIDWVRYVSYQCPECWEARRW